MPFAFFLRPIYSADNDNSNFDAAGEYDLFHVIQGDAFARCDNCSRFLSGQLFKEDFPGSDYIKSRGRSDGIPKRKPLQKKQVLMRHIRAIGPDDIYTQT